MSFDNVCKLLAEKYPADFVRWLTTDDTSQIEVLKTELSIEPIRADSVIFIKTSSRILHIEFQTLTQSKPVIPFRMLDYSVRLKRQYQCPILQVVISLQETDNEIAWVQEYVKV
jgi:predicted transposase YdaD